MTLTVVQNVLTNPDEVNAADSWSVAKYAHETVASTTITRMDVDEALELGYLKTQSIDSAWYEDPFWSWSQKARSSMVGDWIVVDGETYEVDSFGFKKIS